MLKLEEFHLTDEHNKNAIDNCLQIIKEKKKEKKTTKNYVKFSVFPYELLQNLLLNQTIRSKKKHKTINVIIMKQRKKSNFTVEDKNEKFSCDLEDFVVLENGKELEIVVKIFVEFDHLISKKGI